MARSLVFANTGLLIWWVQIILRYATSIKGKK